MSDRVEKEGGDSLVVMNLERGNLDVVRGDWRQHMHAVIAEDLRRFRDYKGWSVRDLLRALRNKVGSSCFVKTVYFVLIFCFLSYNLHKFFYKMYTFS